MEIKNTAHLTRKIAGSCLYAFAFLLITLSSEAQQTLKIYGVKEGNMFIKLSKNISEASLDSFIIQYELYDLGLKYFFKTGSADSLERLGWKVEENNPRSVAISKKLKSFKDVINPADKILLTQKQREIAERFPSVSNSIRYGYNRFRNKYPFVVNGEIVTFFLKDNLRAKRVMLAGSFNVWESDALAMTKTDSGWIANVKLTPGKYWYKFIADGRWMVDEDNTIRENDEYGNTNSVYFKTNIVFSLKSFQNAGKIYLAGSFNNWRFYELLMNKTTSGWQLPLYLADGTHTYRYNVDGQPMTDPGNPDKLPGESNDYNSVIKIGPARLFKLNGYKDAKQVVLTGSFNNWRKDELFMKKTEGGWELSYAVGSGNYEYKFVVDGKPIADPENNLTTNKGNSFLITDANYTFRLKGYPNARNVYLAGDFNDWSPETLRMTREGNEWVYSVHLSPGKHRYKFIVDGEWMTDPYNTQWEQNEMGTGNSVLWIKGNREPQ